MCPVINHRTLAENFRHGCQNCIIPGQRKKGRHLFFVAELRVHNFCRPFSDKLVENIRVSFRQDWKEGHFTCTEEVFEE